MKRVSYQQFAIVAGDTAQSLTEQLNEKLIQLKDKNPKVTFEGLIARISYEESFDAPESLADEYEAQGVRLSCQDCPIFEPILKSDGSEDQRIKWGNCEYSNLGRTYRNSCACSRLFEMINNGEVTLCLAKQ